MDRHSPKQRSANMRAIRSTGMKPEMVVRKLVYKMGYRYRLHRHDLPGRPDLTFKNRSKIIFVHGCFWHQHEDPNCKRSHIPQSNLEYWKPKLKRTKERDRSNVDELRKSGWQVLVLWECQIPNTDRLAAILEDFLSPSTRA